MTEPSWTMNDTDRQIVSGPYSAPMLGVDYSAPWVDGDIPVLTGLAENLYAWLGTLLNCLAGSKPVNIGDGAVGMDSWRRDNALKSRPALNASPTLNRNPVEEARLDAEDDARMAALDEKLKGSILGEVFDKYIDGDAFIASRIESPTGTILDGIIKVAP